MLKYQPHRRHPQGSLSFFPVNNLSSLFDYKGHFNVIALQYIVDSVGIWFISFSVFRFYHILAVLKLKLCAK
jgi:hypothetical protein